MNQLEINVINADSRTDLSLRVRLSNPIPVIDGMQMEDMK